MEQKQFEELVEDALRNEVVDEVMKDVVRLRNGGLLVKFKDGSSYRLSVTLMTETGD